MDIEMENDGNKMNKIVVLQARQWASNRQENGTQRRNPGFSKAKKGSNNFKD